MCKRFPKIVKYTVILSFLLLVQLIISSTVKIQADNILELTSSASTWYNGYNMNMTITNTSGSEVEGWTLRLKKSDFTITNIWCAKQTVSGNDIIITPEAWNSKISAKGSVTFGFIGEGTLTSDFSYTLDSSGVAPTVTPGLTPSPVITPTPIITPTPGISPTPTPVPSGTFHVFLLLGQSNMAGYPRAQASDRVEDPRILALGYDDNQWRVAKPPLHETWQDAIGPGDWFAKTLIEKLPEGDTIGLVPCAISGERIETFMKSGGSKYDWIVSRARLAQEKGGVISGILFHQGESNNGDPSWPGKVNTLVEDLKKDLNLGDIPFIAGELLYSGSCAVHNQLINQLPSVVKNCYVVSAEGLVVDPSDGQWRLHFSHDSQVTLGERYAEKMIEALGY
ncbi:MAG: hypothetical protein GX237_05200 [Clostridiales bacterium]|nr:hypothetical protein [Clostridiales bacterium]